MFRPIFVLRREPVPRHFALRVPGGRIGGGRIGGFTLVELMVAVFVAAILLMIAIPNFRSMMASSQLRSAADEVYSAVSMARTEAIKRNGDTQLCGSPQSANGTGTLGTRCSTLTAGAVVAASSSVAIRSGMPDLKAPLQLDGGMTALRFDSSGIAHAISSSASYSGVIADICTSAKSTDNHRQVRIDAGSIVSVNSSGGACP